MKQSHLRGQNPHLPARPESVGLPPRPFFYTLDQIAVILSISQKEVETRYIYFEERTTGPRNVRLMIARNINPDRETRPDWRIAERELIRWMKVMGFKYYDAGVITN